VNLNVIDSAYLRKDFIYTGGVKAQKVGNTAYLWFESFEVTINETGMKYIIDKFRDCRGFIIDLRANGGGLVSTMYKLGSYFVTEKTPVGYLRYKTGKGHNDFSDYYMEYFKPNDGKISFNKPVVILTGRQSYSAANIFPGFAKGLPNITLMGETTGGGSASPLSIHLLNGWILRMSNFCMTDLDYRTFEFGVEPDTHVDFSPSLERQGKDSLIEAAVMYLNQQQK
jgi:C-terminal processing protease CtpA/Prc